MTQSVDQKASAAASATNAWLSAFQKALTTRDADAAAALFADESYWRDIVSFTWNITTVEGGAGVADLLRATLDEVDPVGFRVTEEPTEADGVITAWIAFETKAGRGSGLLRLVGGKAFTLLTTLDELKGYEEPINDRRPNGVRHGAFRDRVTWAESRVREATELGYTEQPEVLIIGGGQGGIALGARLRQLGVPTIIIERNERPGDSWRKRYKSLALHDPVWYDHLPYIPFPASWPVFSPKDKIGDWLEMYTKVMELNYWGSTTCKSAVREGDGWTVVVDRAGEEITLRPRQLVLALGASGLPSVPEFPGREKFRGDQHHSSAHPGPDKYKGKKAVVIGSNNSAHDICAALWEAGADLAGDSIALIDLDQAGAGVAAADVGSLIARLIADGDTGTMRSAFLSGYQAVRPLPPAGSLRWHTAAALVAERGVRAVNRVHLPTLDRLPELLKTADDVLLNGVGP